MLQHFDAPVNTERPTSQPAHHCDTCTRPVGIVAAITIDDTTKNVCRFCRHSLRYAKIGNILQLINRFFAEAVSA